MDREEPAHHNPPPWMDDQSARALTTAWNALDNQTLRLLLFLMRMRCRSGIAADSFWNNYWLLIFNEKNKQKHLMWTRNPMFCDFGYEFNSIFIFI